MQVTVAADERAFDVAAAWRIVGQILAKPDSVIGLSTGQTTRNMHRVVCDLHALAPFDVSRVTLFNVDELTNLPRSYRGSCYRMICDQMVDPLGIPADHFIMPDTCPRDAAAECRSFEARLAARGGVDLQILGIGWNGHIGINQPGTPFARQTWVSPMDPVFEAKVRSELQLTPDYPLGGLTRGIVNIMQSRRLVLVAKGAPKADIVAQAVRGPVTEQVPASVVQLHPACEVLLDAAAAGRLASCGGGLPGR